jgi:hypothetical protein
MFTSQKYHEQAEMIKETINQNLIIILRSKGIQCLIVDAHKTRKQQWADNTTMPCMVTDNQPCVVPMAKLLSFLEKIAW